MKKTILAIALFSAFGFKNAAAQSFELVKDLYPQTENLLYDYDAGMTFFDGKLYFTSYYGDVVVSDGTAAGTQILSGLGMPKMTASDLNKNRFVPMGGKLYYRNTRNELCVTDGTSAGTSVVADIHPTDTSTFFGVKTLLGATADKIIFVGNDGNSGFELWASDGTAAGTQLVSDVVPGSGNFFPSTAKHHVGTVINNKLYFFAKDATHGWEPWVTDGTAAGTYMLIDSNPNGDVSYGMGSSFGGYAASEMKFFAFNNAVYFTGFSGIYKTDGTAAGTTLELTGAGLGASQMTSMTVFDNHLYMDQLSGGSHMLTKSDGTMAGTTVVGNLQGAMSRGFQEFNGELYFRCKPNGYNSSDKDYIARLSGTQIDSLTRNTAGFFSHPANILYPIGNDFLYLGDYYNHGIYRYNNGANTLANPQFTSVYDNLISTPIGTFAIGTNATHGYELWKWNETATAAPEPIATEHLKLYPNPAQNLLTIETTEATKITILNLLGAKVSEQSLHPGSTTLQIGHLPQGVYLLRSGAGTALRFVKE